MTPCVPFAGKIGPNGYGIQRRDGRRGPAHRTLFEALRGPVDESLDLDHRCRNRSCVNPDHLQPVTHRENMRRGLGFAGQNARKTHCIRGHEFTPENTIPHGNGNRNCRACVGIRLRLRRQESREVAP